MRMPFRGKYKMTQPFGAMYRYLGKQRKHMGVDWALPKNTPVVACFNGIVSRVEKWRLTGYGRSVYLRSSDGVFEALYAHLSSIDIELGQEVKAGRVLGYSGRTGFWRGKTGYHLHFGLKRGGYYIDPLKYLDQQNKLKIPVKEVKLSKREKWAAATGRDKKEYPGESEYITKGYTVKKGDTLWGIAEQFYGDGNLWKKIHYANEDLIKNPKKIYPGQVLKIPGFK